MGEVANRELTEKEKTAVVRITDFGLAFLGVIDACLPRGHEASQAKIKIEEAILWSVQGITK